MWQIIQNREWKNICDTFSWVADMKDVPQDPIHHAEGDVLIHTKMVYDALLELEEFQQLNSQEKEILFAAALLHDVEKRSTTETQRDGRITSRGHARKGKFTARKILYREHKTPFAIKEQIANLVRYHGLPIWVFDKPNPQKAILQASLDVNTHLLYLLSKADALGRICADQDQLLYRIELFREFARENDCYGRAAKFASGLSCYNYFQKKDASRDYQAYEGDRFPVYVMSALAGTGKDHFIKKRFADLPIVSLDAIRRERKIAPTDSKGNGQVIQQAKENARVFLRKKQPFVWNATNLTTTLREPLIALFQSYKATTHLNYLEVPYRTLLRQNKEREHVVPSKVVETMIAKLDVPARWEAPVVEYHCY